MQLDHSTSPSSGLTAAELSRYRDQGYVGPFPLLTEPAIDAVLREWDQTRDRLPWYKGHHVYRGPILEALRSDDVVGRIASVFGVDLLLWGSQIIAPVSYTHLRAHETPEH